MSRSLRFLLLLTLLCGLGGSAFAHIKPDVEVRLVSPFTALQTGDTYEGRLEIICREPGTLSQFDLYGEGWTANVAPGTATRTMRTGDVMYVDFNVLRAAPDTRLEFSVDFEGHAILFPIDLSERNVRKMIEGAPVKAVPDFMAVAGDPSLSDTYEILAEEGSIRTDYVKDEDPEVDKDRSGDGSRRTISVSGRFGCTQEGGGFFPAHSILVEVWDDDSIGDDLLGSTYTNYDGYYSLTVDSGDAGWLDEPDIYVKFTLYNSRVRVYEPTSGNNHAFATSVTNNYTGTNLDYGTLQPADPDLQTTVFFHTQASRAWVHDVNLGYDVPQCRIEYPSAAWPNCSSSGRIQMRDDFAFRDGTLWHEYGHWFDHEMASWEPFDYCNGICDPNFPTDCGHCFWCQESETIAWLEGWAQTHAIAISRWTPGYYGHDPLHPVNAENIGTCGGSYDVPELTEGFIAALTQDIMDSDQDSHGIYGDFTDRMAVGDASVFHVCALDNPTGSSDFITKYRNRYPSYRENFWETAANCGFDPDNTAPGTVTGLSSTSHTAGVPSPDPTVTFTWNRAYDNFSGIQGYGLYISSGSPGGPSYTLDIGDVTSYTTDALGAGTYYFNIRSVDNADNWDADYVYWGPIVIREPEPADLTPHLVSGWDYELVPRMENDSSGGYAPVSDFLTGDATATYWNLRGINQGEAATSVPFEGALNIDGTNRQTVSWGVVNAGQQYWAPNWGPVFVQAGRHSFTCRHDGTDQVPEIDETNNVFGRQFIWTPHVVGAGQSVTRNSPPPRTAGWDEVTSGILWYNADGLNMPISTSFGWWHAMAVWAEDDGVDVDCRLHVASTGAEDGFASNVGYSANPTGNLDIVMVNRNMDSDSSWDVGVLADSDDASYNAYHAYSGIIAFGDSVTVAMSQGQPVLLREFYLGTSNLGPVSVTAQSSNSAKLSLVVLDRNYVTGTATSGGLVGMDTAYSGDLARVSGDLTETGYYCIMVYGDPDYGFDARDITIEVSTTPPDLAVRTPSGWHAPFVPRPADDGSGTYCPLPDSLYAAPAYTYLNVAAENLGPVASTLPTRVFRDDEYISFINWGTIASGGQVYFNWDRQFAWTPGRHVLSFRVDALQEIEETNENNNIWGEQWVWGPSTMVAGDIALREAPPARYGGYNDAYSSGNPFYTNCDGLRLEGGSGSGYWKAMAIRPEGSSDFDLRVHDLASGSQDGYDLTLFGSYAAGQITEYVLMDYNEMAWQNYDVGVVRWSGEDDYRAQAATAPYYSYPDPHYTGMSLGAGELISIMEFRLDETDTGIWLENLSSSDLALSVHKSGGDSFQNHYTAYAASNTGGPGADEDVYMPDVELEYYCVVVYRADDSTGPASFNLHFANGASPVGDEGLPTVTRLTGAYPNPFNPQTQINFDLSRPDHAQVVIYDLQGRVVRRLVDEQLPAGSHSAVWMGTDDSGRQVASGVYFARLESASGSGLTKLVLVK